jgi:MFS family permease
MALGLALQAVALGWLAAISAVDVSYIRLVAPFAIAGTGMALVFAPVANVLLSTVREDEQGKASGANNAIREVGGALGVAVLAAVFTGSGSYRTGQTFVNGLIPAVWTGAAVLAVGAVIALLVPAAAGRKR